MTTDKTTSPKSSHAAAPVGEFVSISEAAKMFGKGPTTIRRLIDKGELEAHRDQNGWFWIDKMALLSTLATKGLTATTRKVTGATSRNEASLSENSPLLFQEREMGALREQVEILKEAVHYERRVCEQYRNQIERLEKERTQHLAEMRALLSKEVKTTDGVISRWLRR